MAYFDSSKMLSITYVGIYYTHVPCSNTYVGILYLLIGMGRLGTYCSHITKLRKGIEVGFSKGKGKVRFSEENGR